MRRYSSELLYHATRESNRIEGEPVKGKSFDNHWRATLLCRTAAEQDQVLHPRVLQQLLFEGIPFKNVSGTLLLPPEPGDYRPMNVFVGRPRHHMFPPHQSVPGLMDEWWLWLWGAKNCQSPDLHQNLVRWWFHAWFESIHPFLDGNGRTGRLLLWSMAMIAGEDIEVIMADEADAYFARLAAWRTDHCNKPDMNPFR